MWVQVSPFPPLIVYIASLAYKWHELILIYFLIRISEIMTATIWNAMKRWVLEWWSKARKASKNEERKNLNDYQKQEMKQINWSSDE